MALDKYVDQILDSPAYVFDDIIEKLIGNNIYNAQIELKRHPSDVDDVLFEAIKSILKDLKTEEGWLSRFVYNKFGMELRRNKRREQLLLLGVELKTQHTKVKSELFRIYRNSERLGLSIIDLKRLEEGFRGKNIYFQNEKTLNKSKFFMKEIEESICILKKYQISLDSKYSNLLDIEKLYNALFLKIPRYKELQEECEIALLPLLKNK